MKNKYYRLNIPFADETNLPDTSFIFDQIVDNELLLLL